MKQNFLYKVMFLAMIAVVSMTFTACGGDDDSSPTEPTGSTEYVEPCLDFGSTVAHVKEYMSGSVWQMNENSNDYTLLYSNKDATVAINYIFIGNINGLSVVTVTYAGYSDSKAKGFKAEIEKRYDTTLTKETDPADDSQYSYSSTATIGGKKVAVMVNCYKAGISIVYAIPD